jgi:signal transduction histidine kinase
MTGNRPAIDDRDAPIDRDDGMEALSRLSSAICALDDARDGPEMADRLVRSVVRLATASGGFVVVRGITGALTVVADARGGDDVYLAPSEATAIGDWFDSGAKTRVFNGPEAIAEALGGSRLFLGATSAAIAPLREGRRAFAAAAMFRRPPNDRPFSPTDLHVLEVLTRLAGRFATARDRNRTLRRERRRLESSMERLSAAHSELLRSEKARTTADLISGVAHELNNPLTAILGYAQMLARRFVDKDGTVAEWASEIAREADRCAGAVRRLSTFASRRPTPDERTTPYLAVEDVLALKAYDLRASGVKAENGVAVDVPDAAADRTAVQHVLLNLVNNAIDVLRDRKRRVVRVEASADDASIELRVIDSGPGVPDSVRDRIFEPFFTSKVGAAATGLGLTACREILSTCGGSISLAPRTEGPCGATFVVRLPRALSKTPGARRA